MLYQDVVQTKLDEEDVVIMTPEKYAEMIEWGEKMVKYQALYSKILQEQLAIVQAIKSALSRFDNSELYPGFQVTGSIFRHISAVIQEHKMLT